MKDTKKPEKPETQETKKPKRFRGGRLSHKEQEYIRAQAAKQSPEAIAINLGRNPATIREWILENFVKTPEVQQVIGEDQLAMAEIRYDFKKTPEFHALRKELSESELQHFEHRYVQHLHQFREDIVVTESSQIFMLIKYEIFMHRNLVARKRMVVECEAASKAVETMYKKCDGNISKLSAGDRTFLISHEERISALNSAQTASSREYNELHKEYNAILKALKSTREQRFSKISELKQTFVELIKIIQDEEVRAKEAKMMELMRMASENELKRLSEPHLFADDLVDHPILTPEVVLAYEDEMKAAPDDAPQE